LILTLLILGGYWLVPIRGQVAVVSQEATSAMLFPQIRIEPALPQARQAVTVWVTDGVPWTNVRIGINEKSIAAKNWRANPGGTWSWSIDFAMPEMKSVTVTFYHSCDKGCIERGRMVIGKVQSTISSSAVPTKLGVVFADPDRNWHGRSGWDVQVTYARLDEKNQDREYWGVDGLAERVQQSVANELRVLVRVDYAQGQSIPPADDQLALTEYLQYAQRLARDERLRGVYGYIIGSGFNETASNSIAPQKLVTAQWYARVFNGHGEPVMRTDNAVQAIRQANLRARILVGPVRPWASDQNGARQAPIDVPWLNYFNTLVAAIDETARQKAAMGIPLAAPDGFAINAPGRPLARELVEHSGAEEPGLDVRRSEWSGAQAGFRVYRDWLNIINAYSTTSGLPVYITSTNTFTTDEGIVPAQNYIPGWLTTAFQVVNQEYQLQALCWFIDRDRSGDARWDMFSLAKHPGRLINASEEFDLLLQRKP
jgi:hypothetical protein